MPMVGVILLSMSLPGIKVAKATGLCLLGRWRSPCSISNYLSSFAGLVAGLEVLADASNSGGTYLRLQLGCSRWVAEPGTCLCLLCCLLFRLQRLTPKR